MINTSTNMFMLQKITPRSMKISLLYSTDLYDVLDFVNTWVELLFNWLNLS